ncbi:Toll-like receptor Tollo [Holothuria leucospilota]|uniref:Toll-like receptor Tollo n=1 Tax=Holothuria leucospilota TaxID=206669 RepID=A0A9Q1BUH3_HOLLE|nr:Toll-like receptor Tollo [Holothuria leucospilota]
MSEMAKFSKWTEITILSSVSFYVVVAINVTDCLQKWDCKWNNYIPFARTEGTCSFIREGHFPIEGPSTVGPPGECNLLISCDRGYGSTPNMFECLKLLAGDAEIKTLHLYRCSQLEINDEDLSHFPSMEEFNISYTSIRSISDGSFYRTNNLFTIDLHQDYYESGIFEYPNALIGPNFSGLDTNGTEEAFPFLPNLKSLLFHNFYFESGIPQNAFRNLKRLHHLTFSHVTLRNSDFLSMRYFTNLTHLEIYDSPMINVIPLDLSSFLPHLAHLELSLTNITKIQSESFSSMSFLETLTLSDNLLLEAINPQTFAELISLNSLSLARNPSLEMIPSLDSLDHLRTIDLSFCAISNLSSELFGDDEDIQQINLRGNKIIDIPNIFANFRNGAGSLENVEYIDLSKNEIKQIKSYTFSNLQNVKFISLSTNQISFVADHAFYNLRNILEIQLDLNALTVAGLSEFSFSKINTLQYLDLTSNKLTNFPKFPVGINWELGENSLPKLPFRSNLKYNPLICDCDMFRDVFVQSGKNSWELPFYHSLVWPGNYQLSNQRFDNTVLKCRTPLNHEDKRIDDMLRSPDEFFTVMDSPEDCPLPCTCFIQCSSDLIYTICNNANLTSIPLTIHPQTNVLTLQNNTITQLPSNSLIHLPNLVSLDLSGNHINRIENGVFSQLNFLRILNLRNNNLTQISSENLNISSFDFHRLDLSSNFISNFDNDTFEAIPSVVRLEFSDNKLQSLPTGVLDNLHSLTYLMLGGNPFNCTCDILYLTNWYKKKVFDIGDELKTDITDLECAPYLNETALIHWVEDMEITCSPPPTALPVTSIVTVVDPYQWGILIIGVVCALVLTSSIFGLVYKFRLEILVLFYIRTGLKLFGKENAKEEKEYDAFISFSSLDREFVLKELVPKLESEGNQRKLCIHHRDFIVGECIATNIINAIENSRKILILCSKNYVESEWCSYEFKSSHQKALKDRNKRIVLIMMEDVNQKALDKEIKAYISTNTYLDRKDPLFWSKLDYAIPKSKTSSNDMPEVKIRVYPDVVNVDMTNQADTKL